LRALILGGTGMLGHRLWIELDQAHETWASIRNAPGSLPGRLGVSTARVIPNLDVTDIVAVADLMARIRPEVVINCVGLVKQHPSAADPTAAIRLNALLPHELLRVCEGAGSRLIQISTDCVFSGRIGAYSEDDPADPEDLYGRTKLLGELAAPALTIRTSMIGRELRNGFGLTEWFLAQDGPVPGYTRATFSGLTTGALARVLNQLILPRPDLQGVFHVSSAAISKFDLLQLMRVSFGRANLIVPEDTITIDRSLDSSRFRAATGFQPATWPEMVEEMARESPVYEGLVL
jgi:dTDP-4-dehydrorhamnose reductase